MSISIGPSSSGSETTFGKEQKRYIKWHAERNPLKHFKRWDPPDKEWMKEVEK